MEAESEASPTKGKGPSSSAGEQLATPLSPPAKKQRAVAAGMPDDPDDAEVIVLSPRTLLATTRRFVCEVRSKGFQREQNLQLHRRGHNLLPSKLEDDDPANKAPRRRVYPCPEPTCVHHDPTCAFDDLADLENHFYIRHCDCEEKKWKCGKCSKFYAVYSDWKAHVMTCGSREYRCDCGTIFSRRDKFISHRTFCEARPQERESAKAAALRLASDASSSSSSIFLSPKATHGRQLAPRPHMSATVLCHKAGQVGATSSSSSYIHTQEITTRLEDDKRHEAIRRVGEDKHAGLVSRESEKHDIMELVMSHDHSSNKRFTTIRIIGAQGLGKTTLASLVYWDNAISRSFEARAWICLSDVCNYEGLLRSVVESITGVSCRLSDRDELEELVREELIGKKFLLVLDDLPENNAEICTHLTPLLTVGEKGSAVMVTTKSNMVVGRRGTATAHDAYYLRPFSLDEFLDMATPDSSDYSPLKSIIDRISSEYYGFPMFAKAIRGILYSQTNRNCFDECLGDTLDSKLTEILSKQGNPLPDLFDLSYSYLRPNQKSCLVYCSLFPRDYTYNKEKLLRLWMSQGFIIPEREKYGNGHSEDAFDDLLRRSFFGICPFSDLKGHKYVMHQFSSHLAWSYSDDKFFRAHGHELNCGPQDVHHLSVTPKQCDSEIYFGAFTEFRDLRTFLLVYNSHLETTDIQFHVLDVKALDECFRNFRCLKTLDLSHTDIRELPESIGYVTSLCFLGLNSTNLRRLPNSVCNLLNLQTLELQNSAFVIELPNDIKKLTSLCHLDASKEHGSIYVPPGIGQLRNLLTLTTFTVGGVSWNCKISELAHLNSLKGSLHIQSLNNVENVEDAKGACLAAKKLKKLSLEWCHGGEDTESDDRIYVAEHVLDALKPHTLLEELTIKGYYGLGFPSWMADNSLSGLVSITLDNCYNCDNFPTLGVLPALRCMFIQNLRGVQFITYEFCATGNTSQKSFPKLEVLKLRDMYSLEYWHDVLDGDFPSLRSLSVERCPKLNSIPRFQFISDISIVSCSKLNLPGMQSLETLKVSSLKQRICFVLPSELRSLLTIEVICCQHLCSLDGLSSLQSLKHLKFRNCPRLNFAQDLPLPGTLETVDVHSNCYALRNWMPNGFGELPDASEVYRKLIRQKCKDKGIDDEMMHEPRRDGSLCADNDAGDFTVI